MSEFFPRADLAGLPQEGLVVVGFSGGADSTALCHWLLRKVDPRRLVLAHVNHCLRGDAADRDEAHARQFAGERGLRFAVFRADIAALAKARGQGVEECGRQVRYQFFHTLAPGENDRVLTAHHAGDNAETVLLHLCRGASLPGLCGIPRRRGKVLRPFLRVTREEIEAYCAAQGLSFVTDESNSSAEYARNRVRLQVLPVLESLNPGFLSAVGRTAEQLSRDEDCLEGLARALLRACRLPHGLDARQLRQAHPALSSRALRLWCAENGCPSLESVHTEALLRCVERGGATDLPGGLRVGCSQGVLALVEEEAQGFCLPVSLGETPLPGGKVLRLRPISLENPAGKPKIHNLLFKNALDCDIITGSLVARSRRPGDRFAPAGRGVTKTLKQLFQENRVPVAQRGRAVLLEWEGRLVFCQGVGVAQGFQVTENTRRALVVSIGAPGETCGNLGKGMDRI